ncbi:hypothetical protein V8G61_04555 [Gaetbulibacter sp. M240]|uniref:hypothetical protein n=1 Tax=Gaetbulibacter sp. M240 TaxID=3126511 RepID=UPI00374E3303
MNLNLNNKIVVIKGVLNGICNDFGNEEPIPVMVNRDRENILNVVKSIESCREWVFYTLVECPNQKSSKPPNKRKIAALVNKRASV